MTTGEELELVALFCSSCFGLFQLVLAYSLSRNTIESAQTSRLFHQPNQPRQAADSTIEETF
jgi:hypothetical protein